jgi:hypothetical protein
MRGTLQPSIESLPPPTADFDVLLRATRCRLETDVQIVAQ